MRFEVPRMWRFMYFQPCQSLWHWKSLGGILISKSTCTACHVRILPHYRRQVVYFHLRYHTLLKGDSGQALFAVLAAFGQIPSCAEVKYKTPPWHVTFTHPRGLVLRSSNCWLFIRGTLATNALNVEMTNASTLHVAVFRCPLSSKIIQEPGPQLPHSWLVAAQISAQLEWAAWKNDDLRGIVCTVPFLDPKKVWHPWDTKYTQYTQWHMLHDSPL